MADARVKVAIDAAGLALMQCGLHRATLFPMEKEIVLATIEALDAYYAARVATDRDVLLERMAEALRDSNVDLIECARALPYGHRLAHICTAQAALNRSLLREFAALTEEPTDDPARPRAGRV